MGYHVSDVTEERRDNFCYIKGTVLRETPGSHSIRKHENLYYPVAELNENRAVVNTDCTCKAGKGFCKHAAAICVFINEENTRSKTDLPMIWNRPPESQLEKYRKGCTIEEMFAQNKENIQPRKCFQFKDIKNVTDALKSENCLFSLMIKNEEQCIKMREERAAIKFQQETELRDLLNHLYDLQVNSLYPHYHAFESSLTENNEVKLSIISYPEEYSTFYDSKIKVQEDRWKDICFYSVKQSESAVWFKERHIRLTASKKVHRIKTRTDNFDSLAVQFKNERYKGALTEAMRYGLITEYDAKIALCAITATKIHDIGLVVCARQPFLACSPDEIIVNGMEMELIEIKCPYSCKDSVIIDKNENKSLVDYLILNTLGEPRLKETHIYYTQIQISLYITGLTSCKLFVYSQHDCVLVNVLRNEQFLEAVIPKIEYFF